MSRLALVLKIMVMVASFLVFLLCVCLALAIIYLGHINDWHGKDMGGIIWMVGLPLCLFFAWLGWGFFRAMLAEVMNSWGRP